MALKKPLTQEERFWMVSAVLLIPVLILVILYPIRIASASFEEAFGYTILATALYLSVTYGVYEIVSSFKVKRPLRFKVKRWLARTGFGAANVLLLYVIWSLLAPLLSSVMRVQYIVILSGLAWEFAFIAILQNPRARRFVKKLT